jgi:thioredoxin reductase (NADPH)
MVAARSVHKRWVTVYCTSWCPHSRHAKALMQKGQVAYEEVDIEQNAAAARQLETWNHGYRSVPTIVVRLIIAEPSNAELQSILLSSEAQLMNCTAYVTTWCPDCRRTLSWFKEYSIAHRLVDIDQDDKAGIQVAEWNGGNRSVPTLDLTLRLTEPSSDQLEAALGLTLL